MKEAWLANRIILPILTESKQILMSLSVFLAGISPQGGYANKKTVV